MTRRRPTKPLVAKAVEMAFAVPQVVAHRVARLALAGPLPSERDRQEFQLMSTEKLAAFYEGWNAMAWQGVRANQALAATLVRSVLAPNANGRPANAATLARQLQDEALGVLHRGVDPVHRKVVANARRLARTRLK